MLQTGYRGTMVQDYMDGQADRDATEQNNQDKKLLSRLDQNYRQGESADRGVFAEMRSNFLIVAGDHYAKKDSLLNRRIADTRELSETQKLRLTKNHTRRICHLYSNNILSTGPNVGFAPKDENSLQDEKKAELQHAVWMDAWNRYNLPAHRYRWIDSFVQAGEVHVFIQYEEGGGELQGYEAKVDENDQPVMDEFGMYVQDDSKPVFGGRFIFKEVMGFNLIRPADCQDLREAEWLCVREMVDTNSLKKKFPKFKDKIKPEATESNMLVFDASKGGYGFAKNQSLVKQYVYRPCIKYPRGQYIFTTSEIILAQGELPGAIFPIVSELFDEIPTTPRGRGPIKTIRPYQVEINRAASKIAEHQITLGDDKLIIQNGSKMSASGAMPGIRAISVSGAAPTVLAGRSGEQYLQYMLSQIQELYEVMGIPQDLADKQENVQDPYVLLYRAASKKKVFQRYISKFENFMKKFVETYMALAKIHLPDDAIISAIGKNEAINISEFKSIDPTGYEVKIEPQSDDIETKFGKQMAINHALQYVGSQLSREDIGKIMREMPFADFGDMFSDFTIDDEVMTNEILALDRGQMPPVSETDNHAYAIKRLNGRMKKPDFVTLAPQIQQAYSQKLQIHSQMDAFQKQQIQRAEQGFIPTTGPLVRADIYVTDPTSPTGKSKKMEIPNDALVWLQTHLQSQGTQLQELHDLPQNVQAQEAAYYGTPASLQNVGGPPPPNRGF
jgi:hypothetical protein